MHGLAFRLAAASIRLLVPEHIGWSTMRMLLMFLP